MKRSTIETSVGIFVLVGILCVGYLTIQLGKLELFANDQYVVFARFESVSGLKKGAQVEIAGIKIGVVDTIQLDQERQIAKVGMKIQKDVTLTDDAIASVKTSGMIGDKYVKISPGGSDTELAPGEMITATESAVDLEELISKYVFGEVK
ncbi:MAG: outer membrane lipid asymmetry maintenance protein MlaD [Proteobacteria bacterium]|nr:outer membrane lipid asymmetry maintenance protein MlaD [Pseudomonadota bacterium]MBU4470924.1 outer membrane lipid asymmetry maintenance protein MlaD [Pseudomonadota bacterium]MCG2751922.1 outer membrane lipid asymmetry maintenance protein MlaD [Desulfobacteraceae bacterium]